MVLMKESTTILIDHTSGIENPQDLKALIEKSLDADKAVEISVIELDAQSAIADYMVVASGTSSRHVIAMADKLRDRLSVRGLKGIRTEGTDRGDWVVLDAGDVIVHLFRPEVREFYNIEKMWGAPQALDVVDGHINA